MAREALLPLRRQIGSEQFSDLRVVVSELVVNATTYGDGDDIWLSLRLEETGVVHGRVEDGGPAHEIEPRLSEESVDEGLGLLIVDTLASTWGVDEARAAVWFEIEPPPSSALALTPSQQVANELINLHAKIHGEAARSADVLLADDAVVAILEGIAVEHHTGGAEDAAEASFSAAIERIVGRRVIAFTNFTNPDADCVCQVFRLAPLRRTVNGVGGPA
jgi:hypothetical protein